MGVLEPVAEAFEEEVPATPPGLRDLEEEDNSEDDLFADTKDKGTGTPNVFNYSNDLSFRNIIPVLSAKGDFHEYLDVKNFWAVQEPKKKYCLGCVEDVRRDLQKLAKVVEDYKKERDAAVQENASLKQEVEELKKLLKQKEESEKDNVKLTISNSNEESVDIWVRNKNFASARRPFIISEERQAKYGVQSVSVNLSKDVTPPFPVAATKLHTTVENKNRPSIADLRREFFAKEFQREETFTTSSFLEIKPEEEKKKKETVRSRMAVKLRPKKKINELISKLTSKFSSPKEIPEAPPIVMFQRFEKTRLMWETGVEKRFQ